MIMLPFVSKQVCFQVDTDGKLQYQDDLTLAVHPRSGTLPESWQLTDTK